METPQPVNLSALSAILAKSRQVMNVVESTKPVVQVDNSKTSTTGYENNRSQVNENYGYDERDEREPVYETYQPPKVSSDSAIMYTAEQVMASKLPDAVKALMIKTPIPQLQGPPSRFSAEDISKITGAPIRTAQPKQMNESVRPHNSDMITVSKSELKEMINEGISTFFKQIYDKTLTEETIKKTINLLIKEGKINVKKKP